MTRTHDVLPLSTHVFRWAFPLQAGCAPDQNVVRGAAACLT
ncbi:hypothetical protein BSLA_01r4354 [Burkholderia stabilis]|nr:hypothetical protein BSLA_01r4354 [Burkholderia stabilis]